MEEKTNENKEENKIENKEAVNQTPSLNKNQTQIAGAIIIAGLIIAGAILIKGNKPISQPDIGIATTGVPVTTLAPVGGGDRTQGNPQAKVTLVLYEDFQCPFCGAVSGLQQNTDALKYLKQSDPTWTSFMPFVNQHIQSGDVLFVYRDFPFLGPESTRSAEAARCAGDQGKFWEYHDYLYGHQNGENKGAFSDVNLKSFAAGLGLNTTTFNQCLDSGKYTQAVADSKAEGDKAGVTGTPKGFILKDSKIVATIDGAEPLSMVQPKIESALK